MSRPTGMHKQRLTLTALALLPLMAACGTQKAGGSGPAGAQDGARPSVAGVHWRVDSVTVGGTAHRAPSGAYVQLDGKGRAHGSYGCNSFSADATLDGGTLDVGKAVSTQMACRRSAMDFEQTLARSLGSGSLKVAATAKSLTLTTGKGDHVDLTAERDAPLTGTTWTIDAITAHGVAESLPRAARGKAELVLTGNGSVHGSLGCNTVNASATIGRGHITFGKAVTTRKLCSAAAMDTERTLLRLFGGKAVSYELHHRTLTLTTADGTGIGATAAG
ncbi:META domain-containing protein [Streptomyces sp. NPDC002004]